MIFLLREETFALLVSVLGGVSAPLSMAGHFIFTVVGGLGDESVLLHLETYVFRTLSLVFGLVSFLFVVVVDHF